MTAADKDTAAARPTHGEGADYPNREWLSPTLSVKRYWEIVELCGSGDAEGRELVRLYCRDRAHCPPDAAEALDYERRGGFVPAPPDALMPQIDIDGLLFVERPFGETMEDSHRWLACRMMEYALAEVERERAGGTPNPCIERYLEPTRDNIAAAIREWDWAEFQKLPRPEQERRLAEVRRMLRERREQRRRDTAPAPSPAPTPDPSPPPAPEAPPAPDPSPAPCDALPDFADALPDLTGSL